MTCILQHTADVHPTQMGQRETEEEKFLIIIKFTSIKKLGIGWDEFGQPCAYIQHRLRCGV